MAHLPTSDLSPSEGRVEPESNAMPGKAERLGYLGMALFLGSLLLTPADEAEAAQFTVSNLNDSGAGSLRQAVLDANGAAGADEIVFNTGLTGVITLTTGQMDVTDQLTITGPGPVALAVDGNSSSRIFSTAVAANGSPLTITGLTLRNATVASSGGAIYANNNALTIDDCVISGNTCTSAGGGIRFFGNYNYPLTITNSTISGNSAAAQGGGVLAVGADPLYIGNVTFYYNRGNNGGGLFIEDSEDSAINNSRFYSNKSTSNGGGIFCNFSDLTLTNCTLSDNSAPGSGSISAGGGGLFFNSDGETYYLTLTDTEFFRNRCEYRDGGGIYAEDGILTLTGCTFEDNFAGDDGGALGSDDVGRLYITGSSFLYNHADGGPPLGGGGAINMKELRGPAGIQDCTISHNSTSHVGGGISFERTQTSEPITISTSYIENNTASYSGGGIFSGRADLTVSESTISGNSTGSGGGGVFSYYGNLTIDTCSVTGNTSNSDGAGIYFNGQNTGNLRVKNTDISSNTSDNDGGALYARSVDRMTLSSCTMTGNKAFDDAGALGVDTVNQFLLEDCLVDGNSAYGDDAGGLFLFSLNGSSGLLNSVITNNYCVSNGGGIYLYRLTNYSPLTISNCTIANNYARNRGGGFALYRAGNYSDVTFTACIVSGNFAHGAGGGLAFRNEDDIDGVISVDRCRIAGNTSVYNGGGVYFSCGDDGLLRITNSTIASNTSLNQVGGGVFFYCYDTGLAAQPLQLENSTVSNNVSPGPGGGIFFETYYGGLRFANSTISGNQSLYAVGGGLFVDIEDQDENCEILNCTFYNNFADGPGAGILFQGSDIEISSSIVSNNSSNSNGTADLTGGFFYVTYSLFGNSPYSVGAGFANLYGYNAYLEPLANNGGPTRTHALSISSPAIDAGFNAAGSAFDQRGLPFLRTVGSQTDIGAVEFNADDPAPEGLPFGFGADSDDDGFSDDAEDAAGTDPFNPNDTPLGGTPLLSTDDLNPLTMVKYLNVLKFSKPGADTIKLKGKIELPDGTPLTGVSVLLDIAGNSIAFTLDEKGAGTATNGKIKVKAPKGGVALITLTMKGAFQTDFADNADMQNVTTFGEAKVVRVAMTFGDIGAFRSDVVVSYKAKQDKTGKAK